MMATGSIAGTARIDPLCSSGSANVPPPADASLLSANGIGSIVFAGLTVVNS